MARKKSREPDVISKLRAMSPAMRLAFLERPEVIRAIGAALARSERRQAAQVVRRCQEDACSGSRIDAGCAGERDAIRVPGMVRAKQAVAFGDTHPTHRWTPAIAVHFEDAIDALDAIEAAFHGQGLSSCSGQQIESLRMRRGRLTLKRTRRATTSEARELRKKRSDNAGPD